MFPDDLHLRSDAPNKGKVFTVRMERAGGVIRSDRSIETNVKECDACRQCPEFDSCYKLCLAKATLESAIATQ